jgi:hypothetical protein
MGKSDGESTFKLIARFLGLARRFITHEKTYVKQVAQGVVKTSLPVLLLCGACLVLLCLSGIFLLVTLVLFLNTWFLPWVSALLVTAFLMLGGVVFGLIALLIARKGLGEAKTSLDRIGEDMRWLKKS